METVIGFKEQQSGHMGAVCDVSSAVLYRLVLWQRVNNNPKRGWLIDLF